MQMMHNAIQNLPLSVGEGMERRSAFKKTVESEDGCGLNLQTVVEKQLDVN